MSQIPILRDYQQALVADIRSAYVQGYKSPLAVLATGGGKTLCFSYIAMTSAAKGKKTLILVHRIELLRQTAEKMRLFGVRTGLISPKYTPDFHAPVQVAMVQTMVKRTHLYRHFDLIVVDEAHHVVASTYLNIIKAYPNAYQLGVTATPVRGDGKGLGVHAGGIFDTMVLGPSTRNLIDRGFLVEPSIYAPPTGVDLSGIKITMGDYNKKQLSERLDKRSITGNAVEHYAKHCPGEPAVVFCVSVEHAKHVASEFTQNGYQAYAVDGAMDDYNRDKILSGLGNGSVQVVCSCDIISEGTDIPAIACAILLRPTQSEGLYLQQVGRALRPSKGKDRALILDHVGNVLAHGLPDQDREWSLDGVMKFRRKNEENERVQPIRQCQKCYNVFKAHLPACPSCGEKVALKGRTIEEQGGELQELTAEQKVAMQLQKKKEVGRAKTLEELEALAKSRGYKPGWAKHIYNELSIRINRNRPPKLGAGIF